MRILASTTAGAGHFMPMIPVLAACRQGGHDVLVACPASFTAIVEGEGFAVAPFAEAAPDARAAVMSQLPGMSADEANRIVVGEVFASINTTAALPQLASTLERWQPDLVLRDPSEFASWLLAEHARIPRARVSISLLDVDRTFAFAAADALRRLPAAAGLSIDAPALTDGTILAAAPATFDPAHPRAAESVHRYAEPAPRAADVPPEIPPGEYPLVYVTFGTVAASLGAWPATFRAVIDGLAGLQVRVLVTTGRGPDPADLGPLPPNAAVAAFVPQAAVLRQSSVAVVHGGFGTVLGALRAGVPMVVAPLFADQSYNAARVGAVGAGVAVQTSPNPAVVPPGLAEEIRAAVLYLLEDPGPRVVSRALAEEMATHAPAASLVPVLEALTARGVTG